MFLWRDSGPPPWILVRAWWSASSNAARATPTATLEITELVRQSSWSWKAG